MKNKNIKKLFLTLCITSFFATDLLSSEIKDSCFTTYPNVLVRSIPSQKGEIIRKIEQPSLVFIQESKSEIVKIEIRNKSVEGNWVKASGGWIFSRLIKCIPKVVFAKPDVYHNGELPFKPEDQANWIAIYDHKNNYSRELIQIKVKRDHDPIVDEKESIKTGYRVVAKNNPVVLIKGIQFKEGRFAINKDKIPSLLELGKEYKFTFGNNKYILKSSGERIDSETVKNYKLTLRKNDKEMIINSQENRYEIPSLIFTGDIDGDGELDFIFDLADHYNVSDQHLYISSEKENDFFVVPVSAHSVTGC